MGKSGSAPQAPDPYATAEAQGNQDRKTFQYALNNSRTSTVNPFGKTSWNNNPTFDQAGFDAALAAYKPAVAAIGSPTWGSEGQDAPPYVPGTPASSPTAPNRSDFTTDHWTNTQELSPESQGIYDSATAKLKTATDGISTNASAYNDKVAKAVYDRMRFFTDPADAAARSSMQSNLADRGFQVGNEGYQTEMDRMDAQQGRNRTDAANAAQIAGASQGMSELSMQQQIAQALSGLRNQQVAGVSGMPTTTTAPGIQAPDLMGLINNQYQSQLDAYNAEQASNSNLMGSLLSMGGMVLGGPLGGSIGGMLGGSSGGMGNTSQWTLDQWMGRK